ncbi:MAG: hypothetical protein LBD12_07730 [Clostridiales Family XIII bacterium]|jgi:hypothetical protein|nr:hypothetical protein [Clostridiales Family XIII bacterium]
MDGSAHFTIPVVPKMWGRIDRDTPIPEGENLLRALRHEKPLFMPNLASSSQMSPACPNQDSHNWRSCDYTDWFGVFRKYSEEQASCTPVGEVLDSILDWEEKVVFPDLDALDWSEGAGTFVRDGNLALHSRFNGGVFQRLHALEGFENALVDLISEPDACRSFFEAMADFAIDVFRRLNAVYHYDYFYYHDDWGTARAPFFSLELFEKTLLPPTIRIFKAIKDEGVLAMSHNCGLINDFIPYIVDEIGADALEIQPINDIPKILSDFGDRCTVEYIGADTAFFYDPSTTQEMVREKARETVDRFGAHRNPGAGVITSATTPTEEMYRTFEDELYRYSLEQYRGL